MSAVRYRVLIAGKSHEPRPLEQMEIVLHGSSIGQIPVRTLAVDITRGLRERGWDATAYQIREDQEELL